VSRIALVPAGRSWWADPVESRSFWLAAGSARRHPPLTASIRADVVVVGAGFTGLWTAYHLLEDHPRLSVVVLEAGRVGYGASGRNGGFAMTMVGRGLADLVRKVGPARARYTYDAMRTALDRIEAFAREAALGDRVHRTGVLTVSNSPEQDRRIARDLEAARALGLSTFRALDARECQAWIHSPTFRLGHYEPEALLVDPAALVRALADAVVARGGSLFEESPATLLTAEGHGVEVATPTGSVSAERALIATNAYARAFFPLRRYVFTVLAYVLVTEPLSPEQWASVGFDPPVGVEDRRVMHHFFRPTPDGRLLWGGRDAPIAPDGPDPARERDPVRLARLEETLRATFPQLSDVRIAQGWAGPVCGTVRALPFVGTLGPARRIVYALGYSGHGVGPSYLVATVARDLLLDRPVDPRLPLTGVAPVPLPPAPWDTRLLTWAQNRLLAADDQGGPRSPWTRLLLRMLE
jgi:glycine/D-amino acid oxidase-like deaminating enzyme